jgi:hypothetical protein
MSYIGTNKVGKMYLGGVAIGKAYLGSDLVYDSAGGGSVTPSYTALNYIKFTASQWILTDYYPKPNSNVIIDMQFEANGNANGGTGMGNAWLGTYGDEQTSRFSANFGGSANQYNEIFYWMQGGYVSQVWLQKYDNLYNRSTWTYLNNVVTFQGISTTTETKTGTCQYPLIFGRRAGTSGVIFNRHNIKVYSLIIKENDVTLHEYYPKQRDSDGVNGLYDIVTDTFITSQTATNLIGA